MITSRFALVVLTVFLFISFIGNASAQGLTVTIEPQSEVIENVDLKVSTSVSIDVAGNMSVSDGAIDFYVTSPSGRIVVCYNETTYEKFTFPATENGTYTFHLCNAYSPTNVTASLWYGRNFEILLSMVLTVSASAGTRTEMYSASVAPSIDWIGTMINVSTIMASFATALGFLYKLLGRLCWYFKHRRSKTPVIISP
jgi:hypothetical protein